MTINSRLSEHLKDALDTYPKDWFILALQGSQNYGIADDRSDVDSKLLLLPTVNDLVYNNKPVSHTHIMENNEHVDCKDIREYFKVMRKMNTNFLEILYTDYKIINEEYADFWKTLVDNRDIIVHGNEFQFMKCCYGMVCQKAANMLKDTPANKPELEKWGYNAKDLSHLVRIYDLAKRYSEGEEFSKCLKNDFSYYTYMIKRHLCDETDSKEKAEKMRDDILYKMHELELKYNSNRENIYNKDADEILNSVLYDVCSTYLRKELN